MAVGTFLFEVEIFYTSVIIIIISLEIRTDLLNISMETIIDLKRFVIL